MSPFALEARGVCLDYDRGHRATRALRDVTIGVRRGEFVGIMGPSGSGKSSLLHLLGGLRHPTNGDILFEGQPWPRSTTGGAKRRRVSLGLVFQEPFLIPHWTVEENIRTRRSDLPQGGVEEIAEALGITSLLGDFPDCISLGERQRVSVARALAHHPSVILADEPTSSLDTENGRGVMRALASAARQAALVVCSHDRRMLEGADRLYSLVDGILSPAGPEAPTP